MAFVTKIKCPACRGKIPSDATRCMHCSIDLTSVNYQQAIKREVWRKLILVGALLSLILLPILIGRISSSPTPTSSQSAQPRRSVSVGNQGFIRAGTAEIILTVDEIAYDDFIKAGVANDTTGMAQIVLQGRGFFVPNGTKVLVIDSALAKRKVRVLEGEQAGRSGWLPYEFVSAE